jgi:outer membrane protein TolC
LAASALALALALTGCAVGPDFVRPTPAAPDDWTSWRSGDASLRIPGEATQALPAIWWQAFDDATLNALQRRAFAASPDLQTAALHFAQARAQRSTVAAQRGPEVNASGSATRQRQSESGASTRMLGIRGADPRLTELLAEPFTLYQAGFDASWELDLWGRVRRSVEAADADVGQQAALLDQARLSLASDVARNYFELRTAQRQIRLMREDIAALEERAGLFEQIEERSPEQAPVCDRLRREHASLIRRLDTLRATPPLDRRQPGWSGAVRTFLDELSGHENCETDLLTRALDGSTAAAD